MIECAIAALVDYCNYFGYIGALSFIYVHYPLFLCTIFIVGAYRYCRCIIVIFGALLLFSMHYRYCQCDCLYNISRLLLLKGVNINYIRICTFFLCIFDIF